MTDEKKEKSKTLELFVLPPSDADREWVVGDWRLRGADWSPWNDGCR